MSRGGRLARWWFRCATAGLALWAGPAAQAGLLGDSIDINMNVVLGDFPATVTVVAPGVEIQGGAGGSPLADFFLPGEQIDFTDTGIDLSLTEYIHAVFTVTGIDAELTGISIAGEVGSQLGLTGFEASSLVFSYDQPVMQQPSSGSLALTFGAALIQPVSVLATSQAAAGVSEGRVGNLIDGSGLMGAGPVETRTHDAASDASTMWYAGALDGGLGGPTGSPPAVASQALLFDLGGLFTLEGAYLWNYNQSGQTQRGVDRLEVLVSTDTDPLSAVFTSLGTVALAQVGGGAQAPEFVPFSASPVRLVRFEIESAHSGAADEHVGLSEVRFTTRAPATPVPGLGLMGLGVLATLMMTLGRASASGSRRRPNTFADGRE